LCPKKVRFALHPTYSPDVVPSDFFLFEYFQRGPSGLRFQTTEELLAEARKLMGDISAETFLGVFHASLARCQNVILNDGDYFE
jgi:hypothetical protein